MRAVILSMVAERLAPGLLPTAVPAFPARSPAPPPPLTPLLAPSSTDNNTTPLVEHLFRGLSGALPPTNGSTSPVAGDWLLPLTAPLAPFQPETAVTPAQPTSPATAASLPLLMTARGLLPLGQDPFFFAWPRPEDDGSGAASSYAAALAAEAKRDQLQLEASPLIAGKYVTSFILTRDSLTSASLGNCREGGLCVQVERASVHLCFTRRASSAPPHCPPLFPHAQILLARARA